MTESSQGNRRSTSETPASVGTVKYTGSAGVREITTAQWKAAGVEGQKTIEWSADNEYTVLQSELSAEALEILKRDKNLKISS